MSEAQAAGSSGQQTDPEPQRIPRRTAMACQFCRGRKLKCDGRAPCTNCEKRHIQCTYVPVALLFPLSCCASRY
ncbi:hypothetical protein BDW22DRAFT_1400785 [Trametopsis cervina]|nr:hypothetical protein BDW22DRAFT_1400785 [Trametopsis cervina]